MADYLDIHQSIIMTSSNGNIFRDTGPLWGESGEFPSQRPVTRNFDVFFDLRLNKRLSKNRDAGDLRRHQANHDVTVMLSATQINIAHTNTKTFDEHAEV